MEPEAIKPLEPIIKPPEPVKPAEKSPVQALRSPAEPVKHTEKAKPVESVKPEESKQVIEPVKHVEPVETVKSVTVLPIQATVEELHPKPEPTQIEEVKRCFDPLGSYLRQLIGGTGSPTRHPM